MKSAFFYKTKAVDESRKYVHQNKMREFVAWSNIVLKLFLKVMRNSEKLEIPVLNKEQEIERDIERFEIKSLSNIQVRDKKSILRKCL